jgi:hypothetical protein
VRRLIRGALDEGRLGGEHHSSRWTVVTQGQSELRPEEERLAGRLLST